MNRTLVIRAVRRMVVLAATVAVLGLGVMTVQAAAGWRAEAAPLDVAPAGMTTISNDLNTEAERAKGLAGQVDDVSKQLESLKVAVSTANGAMSGDTESATSLQAQMTAAKAKLDTLQGQLKAGQKRLDELNKAAARQAALNRAAASRRVTTTRTTTTPVSGGGEPND
jgi:peptidoglycan hydrolase CwlO-like protein